MPQLLQWCTLSPQGESKLAAIRFAQPIRITSIRIFPKDVQPFKQVPDIISSTEPEAFFLELFFNAQELNPNPNAEARDQQSQRAPNALVPTSIAYAGGTTDFYVDMGTEYATRLMIVKGEYDFLSMAIYGEIVTKPTPIRSYEQTALPVVDPLPLSKSINPASASDPKELAEKLLSIISDSVPLPLVVRLLFCLKATDDDWDNQDFPHLYTDLENTEGDFSLEDVVNSVGRPVEDGVSTEAFLCLTTRISDFLGPKDSDQAYFIAKLVSIAAPQNPEMAKTVLDNLNLAEIFDESVIDKYTMNYLFQACANRDIANHISKSESLLHVFETLSTSTKVRTTENDLATIQSLAKRLLARMQGWPAFEKCLTDESGDFREAVEFLKDITLDENSLGIWLSCMLLNHDMYSPMVRPGEASSEAELLPPPLFKDGVSARNQEEFLTFVRAVVGVTTVLATFAFADGLPYDMCRERSLAIINIWQTVEGYDNIANQLLQLRQLTSRLIWIIGDSNPPRKSCIFAERILAKMGDDPEMYLRNAFADKVLDLNQPLGHIAESERLALRKNALVAKDGLVGAVEELVFASQRPFSLRRLRTLRVSAAIVRKELASEEGEWHVLQQFWHDGAHGLVTRLVDLVAEVAEDISKHFALPNTSKIDQAQVAQLFSTANDLLHLLQSVSPGYPLTSRALRSLTTAVADIFVCSDSADASFAQGSDACTAAQAARQACLDVMLGLTGPHVLTETGVQAALVVLRALMAHAVALDEHEPVHKLLQVYSLIDHVVPYADDREDRDAEPSYWTMFILPRALGELKALYTVLDLETRLHLFRRLVRLDDGVTGIGEWLLTEELKGVLEVLKDLGKDSLSKEHRMVLRYQLSDTLDFILDIAKAESSLSTWYSTSVASNQELSRLHANILHDLLDKRFSSSTMTRISQILASKVESNNFAPDLRFSILLHILRNAQTDPTLPGTLDSFMHLLRSLPSDNLDPQQFRVELGLALASYSEHSTSIDADVANTILQVLEWAISHQDEAKRYSKLQGLTIETFQSLCDTLARRLPDQTSAIEAVRSGIAIDEDEVFAPPSTELPSERLQLSLDDVQGLLQPVEPERPSTPEAGYKTPDILGTVISPPTALLRSPAATGLTKTYVNDDFRQLRQAPSARLNTSRLPSMHVDDFETAASSSSRSPTLVPADIVMGPPPTFMLLAMPGSPTMPFNPGL